MCGGSGPAEVLNCKLRVEHYKLEMNETCYQKELVFNPAFPKFFRTAAGKRNVSELRASFHQHLPRQPPALHSEEVVQPACNR